MASPADMGQEGKRAPLQIVASFARLSLGYWTGPGASRAWLLSLGFMSFVLVGLAFQIAITLWNRYFFNALESKDAASVLTGALFILGLTAAALVSGFTFNQINLRLRLRWREWLTTSMLTAWLVQNRFYRLSIDTTTPSNPEYRIAEDIRIATEIPTDIAYGLTSAVLSAVTFIGVLWIVGGSITLTASGGSVSIPGYMVLGVFAYSILSSTIMALLGRPLIRRVEIKNAAEAQFRYELTRVRENAEDIALIHGSEAERSRLSLTLSSLAARWIDMIDRVSRMTGVSNANATIVPAIPLLLAAPKYLAGQLSLGEVMQLAAAFLIVHQALNWLADNSVKIAEWLASADRVVEFGLAIGCIGTEAPDPRPRIAFGPSGDGAIHVSGLAVEAPTGTALVEGPEIRIERGEHVLVQGSSATGKSTLVRTLAGLWPWGRGRILIPASSHIAFLLQRPYLPLGTLRNAICYPGGPEAATAQDIVRALQRCDLYHLSSRLDAEEDWSRSLSGSEQQRLAFVRLLVSPPGIVVLDEATSALDETGERRIMSIFHEELAGVTVIGVGRRTQHEEFYDRKISLVADGTRPAKARHDPIGNRRSKGPLPTA